MYAYISGKITNVNPKNIVIENNGIGYMIIVPNPFIFTLEDSIKVYTHQIIKEDSNNIYGFKTTDEKQLFLKLLNVSGIGPKSALSMLASGTVEGITNAINSGDSLYLKKFPGIGNKSSQQIILDLAGKIDFKSNEIKDCINNSDTYEALISLGYKKREVEKALKSIDNSLDTETKIKLALKSFVS